MLWNRGSLRNIKNYFKRLFESLGNRNLDIETVLARESRKSTKSERADNVSTMILERCEVKSHQVYLVFHANAFINDSIFADFVTKKTKRMHHSGITISLDIRSTSLSNISASTYSGKQAK